MTQNTVAARHRLAPVAVGGVGGSGTRLIATLLQKMGCFLGTTLNIPQDNLWFSTLLRRQSWFKEFPSDTEIDLALGLFFKAQTQGLAGQTVLTAEETLLLDQLEHSLGIGELGIDRLLSGAMSALRASLPASDAQLSWWGWKEPNTHIFLPQLARQDPSLRYIHVLRSGLDMAFSQNQAQSQNWGRFLLGRAPDPALPPEVYYLEYWIAANRRAVQLAQRDFPDRFLLLNYDRLCAQPETELPRMARFLGLATLPEDIETLIAPVSVGRHKERDTSMFSPQQLQAVRDLEAME